MLMILSVAKFERLTRTTEAGPARTKARGDKQIEVHVGYSNEHELLPNRLFKTGILLNLILAPETCN
jgi:hypothetical protein